MSKNYEIRKNVAWVYYLGAEVETLEKNKCGKWMHFYENLKESDKQFVADICEKAVATNIVVESKHTNSESNTGVACFYLNIDDIEAHRRVLKFFLENNLIKRTKAGKLYNISFKLDTQTRAGEYGADFTGKLSLSNFVDLETGEFII